MQGAFRLCTKSIAGNSERVHLTTGVDSASLDPLPTRGALLDQKLGALISSVTTALDEYLALSATNSLDEAKPEVSGAVPSDEVFNAIEKSARLDNALATAAETIEAVTRPASENADNLKRTVADARSLNSLAIAEVRMPRAVAGWLRKTTHALHDYPNIIRAASSKLRKGVDIAEIWMDAWSELQQNISTALCDGIRSACTALDRTAKILDGDTLPPLSRGPEPKPTKSDDIDSYSDTGVRVAVERKVEVQANLRLIIEELEAIDASIQLELFSSTTFSDRAKRRSELLDDLVKSLKELERLQSYLSLHRHLAGASTVGVDAIQPSLSRVGAGIVQSVFEQLAQLVMRELGRPVQGGEIAALLRARGLPIGGTNETRTAWNRLWQAKRRGVLINLPSLGYWPAGDPLPKGASDAAIAARKVARRRRKATKREPTKRPGGQGEHRRLSSRNNR